VEIPGTGFRISGYIDRLDLAGNGQQARVRDYKTGRPPKTAIRLNGGRELQRCLYGFAVQALLGHDVSISASLLYLRDMSDLQLDDPEATLTEVAGYLRASREALRAGGGLIGPDSGGDYDDLAFALPANAGADYCRRKTPPATLLMGEAARVWDAP
jgi:RecB family exonuclease